MINSNMRNKKWVLYMKPERLEAYNRLREKIERVELKKGFKDKKEILLKMAAVSTGLCEDPANCDKICPLDCPNKKH